MRCLQMAFWAKRSNHHHHCAIKMPQPPPVQQPQSQTQNQKHPMLLLKCHRFLHDCAVELRAPTAAVFAAGEFARRWYARLLQTPVASGDGGNGGKEGDDDKKLLADGKMETGADHDQDDDHDDALPFAAEWARASYHDVAASALWLALKGVCVCGDFLFRELGVFYCASVWSDLI